MVFSQTSRRPTTRRWCRRCSPGPARGGGCPGSARSTAAAQPAQRDLPRGGVLAPGLSGEVSATCADEPRAALPHPDELGAGHVLAEGQRHRPVLLLSAGVAPDPAAEGGVLIERGLGLFFGLGEEFVDGAVGQVGAEEEPQQQPIAGGAAAVRLGEKCLQPLDAGRGDLEDGPRAPACRGGGDDTLLLERRPGSGRSGRSSPARSGRGNRRWRLGSRTPSSGPWTALRGRRVRSANVWPPDKPIC